MSAIRALRQLSRAVSTSTVVARSSSRISAGAVARAALRTPSIRAFSVSARAFGQGATDSTLISKLSEEHKYEVENVSSTETPEFLKTFKAQGVWEIEDTPYQDEVALTRKFGNETLRVVFSIADIRAEEDEAFDEENAERLEEDEEHDEEIMSSYPIRVSLTVTKPTAPGALSIDLLVQDGSFVAENITYYTDSKVGTELTAEADWKRRGIYLGPQFDTLDVGLQEEWQKWFEERGINDNIALFIPEYAEWKEQKEYVRWLEGVKSFIEH